jgi:hypothetical protein
MMAANSRTFRLRSLPFALKANPCQSAFKFDPGSASNFDPFERRVLTGALASSELAGVAETWRRRRGHSGNMRLRWPGSRDFPHGPAHPQGLVSRRGQWSASHSDLTAPAAHLESWNRGRTTSPSRRFAKPDDFDPRKVKSSRQSQSPDVIYRLFRGSEFRQQVCSTHFGFT